MQQPFLFIRPTPVVLAVLACFALLPAWAQQASAPSTSPSSSSSEEGLPEVRVKANRAKPEGDADRGYRSSTASQVGALGAKPLQDTPFSISIVSSELLENLQATKADDYIKINPVMQLNNPQSRFFSGVTLRGFGVGSSRRTDGVPSNNNYINVDLEDKERVEVLTGLSGFLYGPGAVGGTINYVLKRPTVERLARITTGITEGSNAYVHGDFGGALDAEGKVAGRLNVVAQDGDTAMDHQSINRQLISGALDWSLTNRLKLQFDASYSNYKMWGSSANWTTSNNGAVYRNVPDADKYWGQPFTFTKTTQIQTGARLLWTVSDDLSIRAGAVRRNTTSDLLAANNAFSASGNSYTISSGQFEYPDILNTGLYGLADIKFRTGPVRHEMTTGFFSNYDERTNFRAYGTTFWSAVTGVGPNLTSPTYLPAAPPAPTGPKFVAGRTRHTSFVIGDDIRFNDQWSVLLGATQSTIYDRSREAAGGAFSSYESTKVTPSVSLLLKPVPSITIYTSYIESLENGVDTPLTYTIPGTTAQRTVTNGGKTLAPLTSEQVEVGVKATVGGTLLTAALFQIDKGLQYWQNNTDGTSTYVQDGRQVHRGLELTSTGRVWQGLTLVSGLTLMDATIKNNRSAPSQEGKTPAAVAETMAKVYAEYDVPALTGLTLTGGVYYTGRQPTTVANTAYLPDFATVDLGARYRTKVAAQDVVLRLNVSNVTGKDYWLTSNTIGAPRTVAMSAQFTF